MLAFTSVYFFESGLFNGLQPIQIRKSGRRLRLHQIYLTRLFPSLGWTGWRVSYHIRRIRTIALNSDSCNNFKGSHSVCRWSPSVVVMAGTSPGTSPAIHSGNASKTGPTWRGPQQNFAGTKLSPLPRSRTFAAPNHVDSRDKPGQARPGRPQGRPEILLITSIPTTNG